MTLRGLIEQFFIGGIWGRMWIEWENSVEKMLREVEEVEVFKRRRMDGLTFNVYLCSIVSKIAQNFNKNAYFVGKIAQKSE